MTFRVGRFEHLISTVETHDIVRLSNQTMVQIVWNLEYCCFSAGPLCSVLKCKFASVCQHFSVLLDQVLKEACRLYAASWVRDIGPELQPNDYKKYKESADTPGEAKATDNKREPSTLEDLGMQ